MATSAHLKKERKSIYVSTLTEALYLHLKNRLNEFTDAEIVARLEASAQLVVHDIDGSGNVDYDDVLRWNRTIDAAQYRGDITDLDQLATAITAGQPEDMLMSLAKNGLANHKLRIISHDL